MLKIINLAIIVLLINLNITAPSLGASSSTTQDIKFGVFPYKSPKTIFKLFNPIVQKLEKQLNCKVTLVTAPDFDTFIKRGKQGKYDLAMPCVMCYFMIQPSGYSVIAMGTPTFSGGVLVRSDSNIDTISKLKNKKIASTMKRSYAGHLFLVKRLSDLNIDPYKEVEFHFLGNLDSIILGVANKQYDAGVVRLDILQNPLFDTIRGKLKTIAVSRKIPQFPVIVKDTLSFEIKNKIRDTFISIKSTDPEDAEILAGLHLKSFVPALDADYNDTMTALKELGFMDNL
ncbi:MAG: phosphate/phosphite/phosphonate ABC transporter substrate-binding protein [Desulfobulbaceae bacterium]|nr:phosphate/phosphite/phosphonate ABC transporter substrate-binding protein [Desulfobulbaceae bacterium]